MIFLTGQTHFFIVINNKLNHSRNMFENSNTK